LGNTDAPEEEKVEALCKLLVTIGKTLDTEKNRASVENCFAGLQKMLQNKQALTSRLRFMIQDTMDLRRNKWVDRVAKTTQKKIK